MRNQAYYKLVLLTALAVAMLAGCFVAVSLNSKNCAFGLLSALAVLVAVAFTWARRLLSQAQVGTARTEQLMTDISHELRTPIAILRAQIEALQDGVQPANDKTFSVLHRGILTLGKLVDDLHDLSKANIGQMRYCFASIDINNVLSETLHGFEDRFQQKQITIDAAHALQDECVVMADQQRLKQLFSNLLENSLRYTNEGGKVVIGVHSDKQQVALYFADSAPGVSSEMLPRIFERFFRTESSRNRVFGGTGLGLAICKSIVEGHGGNIRACQSNLGGLAIEITMPRERSKANA